MANHSGQISGEFFFFLVPIIVVIQVLPKYKELNTKTSLTHMGGTLAY